MLKCPKCGQTELGFQAIVEGLVEFDSDGTKASAVDVLDDAVLWMRCKDMKCDHTADGVNEVDTFYLEEETVEDLTEGDGA